MIKPTGKRGQQEEQVKMSPETDFTRNIFDSLAEADEGKHSVNLPEYKSRPGQVESGPKVTKNGQFREFYNTWKIYKKIL